MKKLILTFSIIVISNIIYSQNNLGDIVNETEYQFNQKNFCISIEDICDMTSKELASMQVQKEDMMGMGNLWKYKFLNKFNMYHVNLYLPLVESVFIDFSMIDGSLVNDNGVTKDVIIDLLNKCTLLTKTETGYAYKNKNVAIQIMGVENSIQFIQFDFQY